MMNKKKLVQGIVASVFGLAAFIGPFVGMFALWAFYQGGSNYYAVKFFQMEAAKSIEGGWIMIIGWILAIIMMVAVAAYIVMVILEACNVNAPAVAVLKKVAAIVMLVVSILILVVGILAAILIHESYGSALSLLTFGYGGFVELLTIVAGIVGLVSCKKAKA